MQDVAIHLKPPGKCKGGSICFRQQLESSALGSRVRVIVGYDCESRALSALICLDLSDKGEVQMVLSKLLLLEGRSILFFELAKPVRLCSSSSGGVQDLSYGFYVIRSAGPGDVLPEMPWLWHGLVFSHVIYTVFAMESGLRFRV